MAKAQQKPKKVSGTRNSDRRNGKASKNGGTDWNAMEKNGGSWGPRVTCKPKQPTGKTIMGYKRERVEKWAKEARPDLDGDLALLVYVNGMKAERDRKKQVRKENRAAFGRLIKGSEKMYRDGTLVHKPTPRIPRQQKGAEVAANIPKQRKSSEATGVSA